MIGQKIRELREREGLMQRQVAAVLDVDTAMVSKMENGQKSVSEEYLSKLSDLLKIDQLELRRIWLASKLLITLNDDHESIPALELALNKLRNRA